MVERVIEQNRSDIIERTAELLPAGYRVRAAHESDADEIVAVVNASDRALIGAESFSVERIISDWATPKFDLETDSLVVLSPDGKIVAYMDVFDINEPAVRVYCWIAVHPNYEGTGIGDALLVWAEERANQALLRAPQEARVVLDAHVRHLHEYMKDLFGSHHFEPIRYSLRMERSLDAEIDAPVWPDAIRVRPFRPGEDDRGVVRAVQESFQDHFGYIVRPFEEELELLRHEINDLPIFDQRVWFLAIDGEEIAGIALCFPRAWDDPDLGWVGTLGVRRPWRRQGLGEALLRHAFLEFQKLGKQRAGLAVDSQNLTGATRLYEKVGLRSLPSRQYDLYEKELRTGKELSIISLDH